MHHLLIYNLGLKKLKKSASKFQIRYLLLTALSVKGYDIKETANRNGLFLFKGIR